MEPTDELALKDQRALLLLQDMVQLIDLSESASCRHVRRTCARAAITNAALIIECVANSCLQSLGLPQPLAGELDKKEPFEKLAFYLQKRTQTRLDKSCLVTQRARAVLALRNHIAHPKPTPTYVEIDTTKGRTVERATGFAPLNFPLDAGGWSLAEASTVARVTTEFLKTYFDSCGLDRGLVTSILVSMEPERAERNERMAIGLPLADCERLRRHAPAAITFLYLAVTP